MENPRAEINVPRSRVRPSNNQVDRHHARLLTSARGRSCVSFYTDNMTAGAFSALEGSVQRVPIYPDQNCPALNAGLSLEVAGEVGRAPFFKGLREDV
jgi:hypothetical protein